MANAAPARQPAVSSAPGSWRWLLGAAAMLPFANGHDAVGLAAWLAPFALLRFSRTQGRALGALAILPLQLAALTFQFRGMVPLPGIAYWIVMVLYAAFATLPFVADWLLARRLRGWQRTLVFPAVWTAVEMLQGLGPFGTWFATGYSQYGNLPLVQLLAVTGLAGLTFLIGWTAAAGNALWESWPRVPRDVLACAGVVGAVLLGGGVRLAVFPPGARTVRVASLTRSDNPRLHPDPKVMARFFRHADLTPEEIVVIRQNARAVDDDLLARSDREADAGARIIFWGEANAPVMKDDEQAFVQRGATLAKERGIYLAMVMASWHLESTPPLENKVVLLQPDGTVAWEYFKAHPVPGGEAAMSITKDGRLKALDTPYGRLTSVICFDADFPRLLAQAGQLGADVILDPSNDWPAIDPWHTRMASFRAVEQGATLVRQTSLGLSAAYDYEGRVLATMDHYASQDRAMVSEVPTRGVRTPYGRLGDWFGWVCVAACAWLAVTALRNDG
jgi:apolipoprotein N-acyltransferase